MISIIRPLILVVFMLSFFYSPIIASIGDKVSDSGSYSKSTDSTGQILSHKIENKKSELMCGEFLLPRAVFSIASRMGQVSRGSCASKGFNAYETSTTLNMGVIGTISVSVYKRKSVEDDKNEFKNPFSQFGYHITQISHKR